jgi:hypothetical protein
MSLFAVSSLSLWSVLIAATAGWFAGLGYYTVLAEPWAAASGTSIEHLHRERAANAGTPAGWMPFIAAFAADLVMATVMAGLLFHMQVTTLRGGVVAAGFAWLGLVATTTTVSNMFGGRKVMLSVIDGGHWLVVLLLMGAVLGAAG